MRRQIHSHLGASKGCITSRYPSMKKMCLNHSPPVLYFQVGGVENVLQHIVGASTADETRLRTHAGSLYFTCPCSTESPIIFSHQFYAKDEFEESFCVTYTLLEPVFSTGHFCKAL
jgi:hypothetical protein